MIVLRPLRTGLIKIGVVGGVLVVYRGRSKLTDLDTKMKLKSYSETANRYARP